MLHLRSIDAIRQGVWFVRSMQEASAARSHPTPTS
jgi:hypothetical protein